MGSRSHEHRFTSFDVLGPAAQLTRLHDYPQDTRHGIASGDGKQAEAATMTRSTENILSPPSCRFVLLLLASWGPLLLPAFLLSTSVPPPRQTSSCFLDHAPTGTEPVRAPPCAAAADAAASCSAKSCYHGDNNSGNGHGHTTPSTTTRGWPAAVRTAPVTMSGLSEPPHPKTAYSPAATTTRISISKRSLLVLGARGGGRSGGDSSRRRTDRPDEYSSDRKKGKGRGGRGGRSGGRGGSSGGGRGNRSSSGSGDTTASGAPSPFEDSGEFWGGESRLSTLDERAPAEFSRKIDSSELSRKPK